MEQQAGKWIVHERGAQKLMHLAEEFREACRARIQSPDFSPWMSSPVLAPHISRSNESDFSYAVNGCLDFSSEHLHAINRAVRSNEELEIIQKSSRLRIFTEIVQLRPESVALYQSAYEWIEAWPAWLRELFPALIKSIVPLCTETGYETGNSFSDRHMMGAIFVSVDAATPEPALALNLSYAHELGHQALMLYQASDDLLLSTDVWVYSGIRRTARPAAASLHASVALAYMLVAIDGLQARATDRQTQYLDELRSDFKTQLSLGLEALDPLPKSRFCERLLQDLRLAL